jgi:hypothetical protein
MKQTECIGKIINECSLCRIWIGNPQGHEILKQERRGTQCEAEVWIEVTQDKMKSKGDKGKTGSPLWLIKHNAMKTQVGAGVHLHTFFTLTLQVCGQYRDNAALPLREKPWIHTGSKTEWALENYRRCDDEKIRFLPLPGNEPRSSSPLPAIY